MVGWRRIGFDPGIAAWAAAARRAAVPALGGEVLRCGGTWAVGLDLLANGPDGAVGGVGFPWQAVGLQPVPLHPGQLSTVYPGYPQPSPDETEAAYRFRLNRDSAHLDGLLAVGPEKRRMVKEPHAWILGLPLNDCGTGASPLVVWEGSHRIIRAALEKRFAGQAGDWSELDVTEAYTAARAEVFKTCRRRELPGKPGEAVWLHRLTIHGVAPWQAGAEAPAEGRVVAYFRPLLASVRDWVSLP